MGTITKEAQIGQTGIKVRRIGLGGMPLSVDLERPRPSEAEAMRVIRTSVEAGTNFIDTADVYCRDNQDLGHNERLIFKGLKEIGALDRVVVATKGGLTRPEGRWETSGHPKALRAACEKSLKNFETDSIPLYQLHAPDSDVPFEDSVGELARLQEEGKIQHIGLSNVSAKELKEAKTIAPIETVQNRCNPGELRDFGNGVIQACQELDVTYLAYSPVGGWRSHHDWAKQELFATLAEKYAVSSYQIILAWLLHQSPRMLPIPGASRIESAKDSPRALDLEISEVDLTAIGRALGPSAN